MHCQRWVKKARNYFTAVVVTDGAQNLQPDWFSIVHEGEGSDKILSVDDILADLSPQNASDFVAFSDVGSKDIDDRGVYFLNLEFLSSDDVRSFKGFTQVVKYAHALACYVSPFFLNEQLPLEHVVTICMEAAVGVQSILNDTHQENRHSVGYCCAHGAYCFREIMFPEVDSEEESYFVYEVEVQNGLSVYALARWDGCQATVSFALTYLPATDANMDMEERATEQSESRRIVLEVKQLVHGEQKISKAELDCPDSVEELRQVFKDVFTNLSDPFDITFSEGQHNLVTDEWIRNYLQDSGELAVVRVIIPAISISKEAEFIPVVHPSQQAIADELFSRTISMLEFSSEHDLASRYQDVRFLIMVPKFNTLKQQTKDRLRAFADLLPDDVGLVDNFVDQHTMIYPVVAAADKRVMEDFEESILREKKTLFVLVVDECHYAPTPTAIPILHKPTLHEAPNYVVLAVSATPFNCITTHSSIPPKNRVEWARTVRKRYHGTSTYVGFEFYARSIAFWCRPYQVQVELSNQSGRVINAIISLQSHLGHQEFSNYDTVFAVISKAINSEIARIWSPMLTGFTVFFSQAGNGCHVKGLWSGRRVPTGEDLCRVKLTITTNEGDYCLLRALGFSESLIFSHSTAEPLPSSNISLDDDFPLTVQHFRSDKNFGEWKQKLHRRFPELKITDGKNSKPLQRFNENDFHPNHLFRMFFHLVDHNVRSTAETMSARNGFSLILDYIFSLAYFAASVGITDVKDITEEVTKKYVGLLVKCCGFMDTSTERVCNLLPMAATALDRIVEERRGELSNTGEGLSDLHVVQSILIEKLNDRNKPLTSENESWFTETDRNVGLLLSDKEKPMIILRVYDKDENLSMQKILRHALQVCFPPISPHACPRFSVIGDFDRTKLYEAIEPEFRSMEINHEVYGKCTLDEVLRRKSGAVKLDLNYEDLAGIPCLVILCEKGRMGDTFPHSLRVLDLRMRTAKQGTTLIQELGRMCRYPKTLREDSWIAESPTGQILHDRFPNGAGVFNAENDMFLGFVECLPQLQRMMLISPAQRLRLEHLKYPLPYALIDELSMRVIRNGLEKREQELASRLEGNASLSNWEDERKSDSILTFMKFETLDSNLAASRSGPLRLSKSTLQSRGHYDACHEEGEYHLRRFLLSAECQIGKTGAFLAYLQRLVIAIRQGQNDIIESEMIHPLVPENLAVHSFFIPHWKHIRDQPRWKYDAVKSGKYIVALAEQRLQALLFAAKDTYTNSNFGSCVKKYVTLLFRWEYPGSAEAKERLLSLLHLECPLTIASNEDGKVSLSLHNQQTLERLLNWDGRLRGNPGGDAVKNLLRTLIFPIHMSMLPARESDVAAPVSQIWDNHVEDECMIQEQERSEWDSNGAATTSAVGDGASRLVRPRTDIQLNFPSNPQSAIFSLDSLEEDITRFAKSRCYDIPDSRAVFSHRDARYEFAGRCRLWFPDSLIQDLDNDINTNTLGSWEQVCHALLHRNEYALSSSSLRYWIFTPSYIGKHGMKYLYLHRRNCFPGWKTWKDYVQVLVVREAQFQLYREYFGADYIILSLPSSVIIEYGSASDLLTEKEFTAEQAGPGFARLFIQAFAEKIGLSAVWMIDDNVKSCYQLEHPPTDSESRDYRFTNATFKEVMLHLEAIFSGGFADDDTGSVKGYESIQHIIQQQSFEGHAWQYGVLGIGRCVSGGWAGSMTMPIKVTHSVYSFFLFNVQAAKDHGVYFPPRRTMEDIEMNFMLEEKGLAVMKMRSFSHLKPVRRQAVSHFSALFNCIEDRETRLPEQFLNHAISVHLQCDEDDNDCEVRGRLDQLRKELTLFRGTKKVEETNADEVDQLVSGLIYLLGKQSAYDRFRELPLWSAVLGLHHRHQELNPYIALLDRYSPLHLPGVLICMPEYFPEWEQSRATLLSRDISGEKILRIDECDGFIFIAYNSLDERPATHLVPAQHVRLDERGVGYRKGPPVLTSPCTDQQFKLRLPSPSRETGSTPILTSTFSRNCTINRQTTSGKRGRTSTIPHDEIESLFASWSDEEKSRSKYKRKDLIIDRILSHLKKFPEYAGMIDSWSTSFYKYVVKNEGKDAWTWQRKIEGQSEGRGKKRTRQETTTETKEEMNVDQAQATQADEDREEGEEERDSDVEWISSG